MSVVKCVCVALVAIGIARRRYTLTVCTGSRVPVLPTLTFSTPEPNLDMHSHICRTISRDQGNSAVRSKLSWHESGHAIASYICARQIPYKQESTPLAATSGKTRQDPNDVHFVITMEEVGGVVDRASTEARRASRASETPCTRSRRRNARAATTRPRSPRSTRTTS